MSEPEAKNLSIRAEADKTEMGIKISLFSKAVNITVELDLDEDPEFFYAMAAHLPQIVEEQMKVLAQAEWVPDE